MSTEPLQVPERGLWAHLVRLLPTRGVLQNLQWMHAPWATSWPALGHLVYSANMRGALCRFMKPLPSVAPFSLWAGSSNFYTSAAPNSSSASPAHAVQSAPGSIRTAVRCPANVVPLLLGDHGPMQPWSSLWQQLPHCLTHNLESGSSSSLTFSPTRGHFLFLVSYQLHRSSGWLWFLLFNIHVWHVIVEVEDFITECLHFFWTPVRL